MNSAEIIAEVIKNTITVLVSLVQILIVASFSVIWKLHADSKVMRRDLNEAFKKIRSLEAQPKKGE